jgi:hypothetical protein
MKNAHKTAKAVLFLFLLMMACRTQTPVEPGPGATATIEVGPQAVTETALPALTATVPSPPTPTLPAIPTFTRTAAPSPTPTNAPLRLEVVKSQAWTDSDGNARANVLLRNPYEFPVAPSGLANAQAIGNDGELLKTGGLYFLDGISGGNGYFLPGETIAATVCFTCEKAIFPDPAFTVEFLIPIADATGQWNFSTEVEAGAMTVTFEADSPIFWVSGSVTNNSGEMLQRISVRVFVFDETGALIGAAETSAWDVGPGATAVVDGYGIGQTLAGTFTYEITALGVNY